MPRYFYQYKAERLPACVLTVHVWLHIVDFMEKAGPLWAYWCWVMERYCSKLLHGLASRKHPYASLNRCVLEMGNLTAVCNLFDLTGSLPNPTKRATTADDVFRTPSYNEVELLSPRRAVDLTSTPELVSLHNRIVVHFVTQWGVSKKSIQRHIPSMVVHYGRIQLKDGDTIRATLAYSKNLAGLRDATFLQYELLVDIHAEHHNVAPELQPEVFFGQLQHIVVLKVPRVRGVPKHRAGTYVLLDILPCHATRDAFGFYEYTTFRAREIVDAKQARALVGRIHDRGRWVIVQRPGDVQEVDYHDPDELPIGHRSD